MINYVFRYVKFADQALFSTNYQESEVTYSRQVVYPRHQPLQGQSLAKLRTQNIYVNERNYNNDR